MINEELIHEAKSFYQGSDPSHDWSHVQRVVSLCRNFGEELGANLRTLLTAAYLHDMVNIPKNHAKSSQASELSSLASQKILKKYNYTDDEITQIAQIILEHSFSRGLIASSLESKILQDVDKLDAIGAIGIMRWIACGTQMNASFYDSKDPWAKDRPLNDKQNSLDHTSAKLLKLKDLLNTEPAKSLGKERHMTLVSFLESLKSEIPSV